MIHQLFLQIEKFAKLIKLSYIKKMPNNKYRVMSENGKNLGEYSTQEEAKNRLRQVEYFKHTNKADDGDFSLDDLDELTYSNVVRELRKSNPEKVKTFLDLFKQLFDINVKKKIKDPEESALSDTLLKLKLIKD